MFTNKVLAIKVSATKAVAIKVPATKIFSTLRQCSKGPCGILTQIVYFTSSNLNITMAVDKCMYPDVKDPTQACPYSVNKVMLEHLPKKEMGESKPKKIKRMDPKPPKFNKNETRDKLR